MYGLEARVTLAFPQQEFAWCWADGIIDTVRMVWSRDTQCGGGFKGTDACFSVLHRLLEYERGLKGTPNE